MSPCTAQPQNKASQISCTVLTHHLTPPLPDPISCPLSCLLDYLAPSIAISIKQNFYRVLGLFSMMPLHIIIGKCANSTVSSSNWNTLFEAHNVWSHPAGTNSSSGTGKRSWEESGDQARKVSGSDENSSLGDLENMAQGAHHAWCGTKESAELSASAPGAKTSLYPFVLLQSADEWISNSLEIVSLHGPGD